MPSSSNLILTDTSKNFAATSNYGRKLWLGPKRNLLIGEYLFGRDDATSKLNSAAGQSNLIPYGPPTYGLDGFGTLFGARLNQTKWFDTQIASNLEMTIMVIARNWDWNAENKGLQLFGNFKGDNSSTTIGLFRSQAGVLSVNTPNSDGTVSATNGAAGSGVAGTTWTTFCARVGSGTGYAVKIDTMRNGAIVGTSTSTTIAGKTRAVGAGAVPLAIGSARGSTGAGTYLGSMEFLAAKVFAGGAGSGAILSDADLLAEHQAHVETFASRGVTI